MNSDDLYGKIGIADKFKAPDSAPTVDHTAQVQTGMDWAARQQTRTAPEPVVTMPPIVPVAN